MRITCIIRCISRIHLAFLLKRHANSLFSILYVAPLLLSADFTPAGAQIGVSAQPSALDLGVQLWTTPSLVARLNQSPPPLTHDEGSGGSALPLVESMLTTLCASLEGPGGLETRAELPQAWTKQGAAARGQEVVDVGKHWEQPFFTFQRINAQVRSRIHGKYTRHKNGSLICIVHTPTHDCAVPHSAYHIYLLFLYLAFSFCC